MERCLWTGALGVPAPPLRELPARVDVAIIGGGYTGLAAALALARAGAATALLERHHLGWGASGRNGGMVLPGYKAELDAMVRRLGSGAAKQLFEDSIAAIDFVEALIRSEGIACDWMRSGHITLAATPRHFERLTHAQRTFSILVGHETELLGPDQLRGEIGSSRYAGGLLDPRAGRLHPAAYLAGLGDAARRAGATLAEQVEVRAVGRVGGRMRLTTSGGLIEAGQVLLATNGYSSRTVPWVARRIVPVGSYIIATAVLPTELRGRLNPRGRTFSDTKHLLNYFRLSPDGRLVFGGRAAFVPWALARSRRQLERELVEVFPGLAGVPIEYAWAGTLGFTRDGMPHAGIRNGLAYALGYGGHGVAMASWLGHRVGRALAGSEPWPRMAEIPFPAIPCYTGRPWFLPLAGAYYRLLDRLA